MFDKPCDVSKCDREGTHVTDNISVVRSESYTLRLCGVHAERLSTLSTDLRRRFLNGEYESDDD